jgi:hypothetical protein
MEKLTNDPKMETDSTSFHIKNYMNDILENELYKGKIKYFSRINGNKLLIILDIDDIKKIKASERYYILNFVQSALDEHDGYKDMEKYIGVDGQWNMVWLWHRIIWILMGSLQMRKFYIHFTILLKIIVNQ